MGLHNFTSDPFGTTYLMAGGVLEIAAGIAVLRWSQRPLLLKIYGRAARDFLIVDLLRRELHAEHAFAVFGIPFLVLHYRMHRKPGC
jgi:hypothetical protein